MPRAGGIYSAPPGTDGVPNTTIESAKYNALVADLVQDANTARPVTAGGTGVTSLSALLSALGLSVAAQVPTGTVLDHAGASEPSGYLFCYGQAVSRATYSDLFDIIGTTYGAGDGSTTFALPDLRGRVVAGQDDMGGSSANRLTSPINGDTLGAAGGTESHTLTEAELAAHDHVINITDPGHGHTLSNSTAVWRRASPANAGAIPGTGTDAMFTQSIASNTTGITATSNNAGSGTAHNNVQPTLILNKIIKT